jgi:hypothetical protein
VSPLLAPALEVPVLSGTGSLALAVMVVAVGGSPGTRSAAAEVARRLRGSPDVSRAELVELPATPGTGADPFRLRPGVARAAADVVLVVAPRRWGPRRLAPGAVLAGRPVAIVQADSIGDLPPSRLRHDPAAPWVVAAMSKDVFLKPTSHWAVTLAGGWRHVVDLRADRARRDDLLTAMSLGPGVVLYAGHGRARGWGGYQALRWEHLEARLRPASPRTGIVLAFACDTLKRTRSGVPFGSRMVAAGVVGAYLGAAGSIRTDDAVELSDTVVGLLAGRRYGTVARLIMAIEGAVSGTVGAARAWRQFRLLGDPTVAIDASAAEPVVHLDQKDVMRLRGEKGPAVTADT